METETVQISQTVSCDTAHDHEFIYPQVKHSMEGNSRSLCLKYHQHQLQSIPCRRLGRLWMAKRNSEQKSKIKAYADSKLGTKPSNIKPVIRARGQKGVHNPLVVVARGGMCGPKGYVFLAVLVINRVSLLVILPPFWS